MANIKISQLPAKGANLGAQDLVEVAEFTGTGYVSKSITGQEIIDAASGGGAAWGSITGTLSTQTDLQTALDAKQDDLVSGTNIKTINSNSLLGSGNVAVQDTLVSGTNIKTINSTSLLGSGNVAVQATLVSGTNIKTINGSSVLGSGNLTISATGSTSNTYIPFNNLGTLSNSVLQQVNFGGSLQALQATNVAIFSLDDGAGGPVANLAANGWGNGSIGAIPFGMGIGYDMYESAFQVGSMMMQTGAHVSISKWLKTVDESGIIYYIPLYS